MFYLCMIDGGYSYWDKYIFDTSDNTCEYISDKDYDLVKSMLGITPAVTECYGFSDYMKYKVLFNGELIPLASWWYKREKYRAVIDTSGKSPVLHIETSLATKIVEVVCKDSSIHLSNILDATLPYELFGVLIRNRKYVKVLLRDVEVRVESLTQRYYMRGEPYDIRTIHIIGSNTKVIDEFGG